MSNLADHTIMSYTITCDSCGYDVGEHQSAERAVDCAEREGYVVTDDGTVLCEECLYDSEG